MVDLCLCLIVRDENEYLSEWIDYHILVGVQHFFIYDNDSQQPVRDVLAEYVDAGWVTVLDIKGEARQLFAYDHCLQTYGKTTRWLGFIDVDEFLVPKTTPDIKDLLRPYDPYAGLAVSSLFFGSSGHIDKPIGGQIVNFQNRVDDHYPLNGFVKCIVQPKKIALPDSAHTFTCLGDTYCVNEKGYRVDDQLFPNSVEKIQLNHYYCRSDAELQKKLGRGGVANRTVYQRSKFEQVNHFSNTRDQAILKMLRSILERTNPELDFSELFLPEKHHLVSVMHDIVRGRKPLVDETIAPVEVFHRPQIQLHFERLSLMKTAYQDQDYYIAEKVISELLADFPRKIILYTSLAAVYFKMNDFLAAWDILSKAWQIAPGCYEVIKGLGDYFYLTADYKRAESTFRLMLAQGPNELDTLFRLAMTLLHQGRMQESIEIGIPVLQANHVLRQLNADMVLEMMRAMIRYLRTIGDMMNAENILRMLKIEYGEDAAVEG